MVVHDNYNLLYLSLLLSRFRKGQWAASRKYWRDAVTVESWGSIHISHPNHPDNVCSWWIGKEVEVAKIEVANVRELLHEHTPAVPASSRKCSMTLPTTLKEKPTIPLRLIKVTSSPGPWPDRWPWKRREDSQWNLRNHDFTDTSGIAQLLFSFEGSEKLSLEIRPKHWFALLYHASSLIPIPLNDKW